MNIHLGRLIKDARKKRGWSQARLAEALGVSVVSINRWEQGKSRPREEQAMGLIEVLKLDKQQVRKALRHFGEQGQPFPFAQPTWKERYATLLQEVATLSETQGIEVRIPQVKVYRGWRVMEPMILMDGEEILVEQVHVTVNGQPLPYGDTEDSVFKGLSPEVKKMYEWGYFGTGPGNLALSMLADYFEERGPRYGAWMGTQTWRYELLFKEEFVAWFPEKKWEVHAAAIAAWVQEKEEGGLDQSFLAVDQKGRRGWSRRWDKYKNPGMGNSSMF